MFKRHAYTSFIYLFILYVGFAYSEHSAESKLWAIYDQNQEVKGYLFGTIHLPISSDRLFSSYPQLFAAIKDVDAVALENPFATGNFDENAIPNGSDFNCETGLGTYLSESEFNEIQQQLSITYGEMSDKARYAYCLTPEALEDTDIQNKAIQYFNENRVDTTIGLNALEANKKLLCLEEYESIEMNFHRSKNAQRTKIANWLRTQKIFEPPPK